MIKNLYRLIVLVVVLSLLAACAPAAEPTKAPAAAQPTKAPAAVEPTKAPAAPANLNDTRPLKIGLPTDVTTFEPNEIATKTDASIAEHIFDTLCKTDATYTLKPLLAESWSLLDTPKKNVWQFKLRKGVKFSNGEDFNANTVKYVVERAMDPNNKFKGNTPGFVVSSIALKGVEVVDDYTVNFVLENYNADGPNYIAEIYMHPVQYYKEKDLPTLAANPIGSGPYKLKSWTKNSELVLERRDDFWGEKPKIKTLVFKPFPVASTAVAELLAGGVDVISSVPPDQSKVIDASGKAKVAAVTGGRRIFVGFFQKCTGPGCKEVKDTKVRQALNMAVDVQTILDSLFQGKGKRGSGVVNPPNALTTLKPYPYDPVKAKALLAEAGYPNGFKTTLATPNGRYQKDKDIAMAVASDLKKVGVEAEVVPYEWSVYSTMTKEKQLPALFLLGMGSTFASAWYDMSGFSTHDSVTNYPQWQNNEWDKLYKQLNETFDAAARKAITDKMQQLLYDEAPWLFIYMQVDWYAVGTNVEWTPRGDEIINLTKAYYK